MGIITQEENKTIKNKIDCEFVKLEKTSTALLLKNSREISVLHGKL